MADKQQPQDDFGDIVEMVAQSLAPVFQDDTRKTQYISYRASGFTVREACHMLNLHERTIQRWRSADSEFAELDTKGLSELRQKYAKDFAYAEFMRNFRMVMDRDFRALYKSLTEPEKLTTEDHRYLNKIRGYYTPEALSSIERAVSGRDQPMQVNFTQWVLNEGRSPRTVEPPEVNGYLDGEAEEAS